MDVSAGAAAGAAAAAAAGGAAAGAAGAQPTGCGRAWHDVEAHHVWRSVALGTSAGKLVNMG